MTETPSGQYPYTVGAGFDICADISPEFSNTTPTKSSSPASPRLTITRTIAVSLARKSQVVLCQVSPAISQAKVLVAKLWDPLYYAEPDEDETRSATELATLHYNNERVAFERIIASQYPPPRQGIPEYHGSWSLLCPEAPASLAGPSTRARQKYGFRTVPLVLMEYVPGCCMATLATRRDGPDLWLVERCAEDYRLAVWARILEIQSWLDHIGIQHNDMETRNFMIDPAPELPDPPTARSISSLITLNQSKPGRVTVIDFDVAAFTFDTSILEPVSQESRPQNPIDKHWSSQYAPLANWLPQWWRGNLPKRREWLLQQFEKIKYCRSAPPNKGHEQIYVFSEKDERIMDNHGFKPSPLK